MVVALAAASWFGVHKYAEYRVRAAFAQAGMDDAAAECMGGRLVRQLSLGQLRRLGALPRTKHSVADLVKAMRHMDDRRIAKVTGTSALLCATGFAR